MMAPPPPPAQCAYPPATSPAVLQQYQYHPLPAAPVRAAAVPAHHSDYYIPVVRDQHSYPVSIPSSEQQQQQRQQQLPSFGSVYDTRSHAPTSLPGVNICRHISIDFLRRLVGWMTERFCCPIYKEA